VRSNTNRDNALRFGALVDDYDRGRLVYDDSILVTIHRRAPALPVEGSGRTVLEIGPGTGQLTRALLGSRRHVIAVEPDAAVVGRLRRLSADDDDLDVCPVPFENVDLPPGHVAEVWAADAFHWVDPRRGYPLVARLLRPGGWLVLLWTFATVAEPRLCERLNDLYRQHSPDLVREVDLVASLASNFADGRREIEVSSDLTVHDHWIEHTSTELPVADYAAMQLSFRHIAELALDQREELRQAIRTTLGGRRRVVLGVDRSIVVARSTLPDQRQS